MKHLPWAAWGRFWAPVVVSNLLLGLAFPPANLAFLVFIALAPWFAQLRHLDARGARHSGYAFGILFFLVQMRWLVPFVSQWTGSFTLAAIPWVLAASLGALYFMLLGTLIHRLWHWNLAAFIPVVWMGVEWGRSIIPELAFPWGQLAWPLHAYPSLIQLAGYGTIVLVSGWVCAINVLAALYFFAPRIQGEVQLPAARPYLLFSVVLMGMAMLSIYRYNQPVEGTQHVVTIGQPAVDMAFLPRNEQDRRLAEALPELMARTTLQGSEFLLLPEGIAQAQDDLPPFSAMGPAPLVPVLLGAQRVSSAEGVTYQSTFLWDGESWSHADKTRLVIFGEYVPLRGVLPLLDQFNLPDGDLTPADEVSLVFLGDLPIGGLVCFEGLFADTAWRLTQKGARLLVVQSLDDWFQGTSAMEPLAAGSVWRAVEAGAPVLRSASLGYTQWVDARGNVMARAPFGELATLRAEVTVPFIPDGSPTRLAIPVTCLGGTLLLWLFIVGQGFRARFIQK